MVWLIFALMTGACVIGAVWPLARSKAEPSRRSSDAAFYHTQLLEIERDEGRGVIDPESARLARAEAGRRLIAASAAAQARRPLGRDPTRRLLAAALIIIVIPVASVALYGTLGSPLMPDQPLEARLKAPPESQDIAAAVARIEAHLAKNPTDGRGYEVLAPVYMRMKRYDEAVRAYLNVINLLGETAQRRILYGEALVYAAGMITPDARNSFEAALRLDRSTVMAEFYLALAAEQDGNMAQAHAILVRIVAEAPADAPYLEATREHLARIDQELARGFAAASASPAAASPAAASPAAAAPGAVTPATTPSGTTPSGTTPSGTVPAATAPSGVAPPGAAGAASNLAATIAGLAPDAQQAAIETMVEGLAARLKADGHDPEGWLRLIRAYAVLKKPALARDAWVQAQKQVGQDPGVSAKLDAIARELGLGG
jgi:cytochrome c-type biogenesis protein CcmH